MVIWYATPLSKCSLLLLFAFSFFKKEEEKKRMTTVLESEVVVAVTAVVVQKGVTDHSCCLYAAAVTSRWTTNWNWELQRGEKRLLFDFKRFFYYWTCSSLYVTYSSGSQILVMGDPQNRIKHNLATHIVLK